MAAPLLETKLHLPRRRRDLVARNRLDVRLGRAAEAALTLVSAPAGFGKSTLLAEWLGGVGADGNSTAWLSLDERDNDPNVFIAYLLAAFDNAVPGVGAAARAVADGGATSPEAVLATLLNDLHRVSGDVFVVLDDYHVIEQVQIHEAMGFLLDHLPPNIHLVISCRADPSLPLARLRAGGDLVEVRAAELRFTRDETAAYLNDLMGLDVATSDVAALASLCWTACNSERVLPNAGRSLA